MVSSFTEPCADSFARHAAARTLSLTEARMPVPAAGAYRACSAALTSSGQGVVMHYDTERQFQLNGTSTCYAVSCGSLCIFE